MNSKKKLIRLLVLALPSVFTWGIVYSLFSRYAQFQLHASSSLANIWLAVVCAVLFFVLYTGLLLYRSYQINRKISGYLLAYLLGNLLLFAATILILR